jgi:anti-sigma B factor antagonist
MSERHQISTETAPDGALVVRLGGEVDVLAIKALQPLLEATVAGAESVTLDLTDVTFLDSAGLRMLQIISGEFLSSRRELRVIAPEGSVVRRLLDLTGLTEVLAVNNA